MGASCADVTGFEAVKLMVKEVTDRLGQIDILVNNAGIPIDGGSDTQRTGGYGPHFFETDREFWERTMNVITYGVLQGTRAVIDGMMERRWGRIINIASIVGQHGTQGLTAYSMAKAGVVGFTRSLAQDVGVYSITANCVSPGHVPKESGQPSDERTRERMLRRTPLARALNRLGSPSDIADAVAFLASERACFITGQNISVSGYPD